jgi:hypothetical protein
MEALVPAPIDIREKVFSGERRNMEINIFRLHVVSLS